MTVTDEMLIAFADGELGPSEREEVMRAIAADPELAQKLAAQQKLRQTLSNHFAPIAHEPVPEKLKALIDHHEKADDAPKIVNLAAIRAERQGQEKRRWLPAWSNMAALAATLMLGLAIGRTLDGGMGPVALEEGGMVAQGRLATTLETKLASSSQEGEAIRIGLTFRSKAGNVCRTFEGEMSGLACRQDGAWRLEQLFPGAKTTAYRQASVGDPRVATSVQGMIEGNPFDAKAERMARDKRWE